MKIKLGLILISIGLVVFLLFSRVSFFKKFNNIGILQTTRSYAFAQLGHLGSFMGEIKKTTNLIRENEDLKKENLRLLSLVASQEDILNENIFLRRSLNLNLPGERDLIDAKIFSSQPTPEGYTNLINKGSNQNVKNGATVVSSSGILIGQIDAVFEDYSRFKLITNSGFKATVKVLDKTTTGILTGNSDHVLKINFVAQNEEVLEGDVIVTNGSDLFPAGLIIGKVDKVIDEGGSLFKDVFIKPEFSNISLDRVLIINN